MWNKDLDSSIYGVKEVLYCLSWQFYWWSSCPQSLDLVSRRIINNNIWKCTKKTKKQLQIQLYGDHLTGKHHQEPIGSPYPAHRPEITSSNRDDELASGTSRRWGMGLEVATSSFIVDVRCQAGLCFIVTEIFARGKGKGKLKINLV